MYHQPFVNVAAMSSYDKIAGALYYRNQWVGIDGAPKTQGVNVSIPIGVKNHIGTTMSFDRIGVNEIFDVSIDYSFKMNVTRKSFLALGISAVVQNIDVKYSDLENISLNDPIYSTERPVQLAPNFKLGAYYFTEDYYIGLAIPKFLDNYLDQNFNQVNSLQWSELHLYINAGYKYKINNDYDLYASTMLRYVSGVTPHIDLSSQIVYKNILGLGLSIKSSKEAMAMLSYSISKELKINYSYENGFNKFSREQNGSHEIMLIFQLGESSGCDCYTPRF